MLHLLHKGISSNVNKKMYGDKAPQSTTSLQHAVRAPCIAQNTMNQKDIPGLSQGSHTKPVPLKQISIIQEPCRQFVHIRNLSVRIFSRGNLKNIATHFHKISVRIGSLNIKSCSKYNTHRKIPVPKLISDIICFCLQVIV